MFQYIDMQFPMICRVGELLKELSFLAGVFLVFGTSILNLQIKDGKFQQMMSCAFGNVEMEFQATLILFQRP